MTTAQGAVLVVDDTDLNRILLARRLEKSGYRVTIAEDGGQALGLIEQQPFDLVLLDIMMPGIDGLEVLKTVRRSRSMTNLPIIMATAMDESAVVVEALHLGANDYVTKPFDFPVVLARVQTQLALKRAVDQIRELEQSLALRNEALEAANQELALANKRMKRDLEAAARIQHALLPTPPTDVPEARFAWRFQPCAELAGDNLNIFRLDDKNVGLYVLDVVGHGVAAALMSVTANRFLARMADASSLLRQPCADPPGYRLMPPAEVAQLLNAHFPWEPDTGQYFTLLYGILNLETSEFQFVSAGHPGPVQVGSDQPPVLLRAAGLPIGFGEGPYQQHTTRLKPGDRLYLYSDGVTEAVNPVREQFGEERLLAVLHENRGAPLEASLEAVLKGLGNWCGAASLQDDVTLLAVEIAG